MHTAIGVTPGANVVARTHRMCDLEFTTYLQTGVSETRDRSTRLLGGHNSFKRWVSTGKIVLGR